MRILFCGIALLAMFTGLASAAPKSKAKPHARPAPRGSKPVSRGSHGGNHSSRSGVKIHARITPSHGKAGRGRYARSKTSSHKSAPRPVVQASPSSDRYREIQEALAAKGYLKTAPSGVWDQDSMDAMRRFQEDQKLTATGKLNSLSLIALGLGPKDNGTKTPEAPRK